MKFVLSLIFFVYLQAPSSFGQNYQQLQLQLEQIHEKDQKDRALLAAMSKKYKPDSKKIKALVKKIVAQDAANLPVVTHILDTYGWIGKDNIGSKANSALFLVIQHADLKTQEKYLPMLLQAVQQENALPVELALLEDRVALRQGKKQLYGSQIGQDTLTGEFYILPLEDPDNVDKRRAMMGLQPMSEYVKEWGIVWKPTTENPPVDQQNKDTPSNRQGCDNSIEFTKIDLPNLDFVFTPIYLANGQLVGFTLVVNPAHFTTYTIQCMDGNSLSATDYRYDKKNGTFIVRVDGVTSEEQLYPSTMIIDGKGYSFFSRTQWFLYKKLSMLKIPHAGK